jgi:hypothetical protein
MVVTRMFDAGVGWIRIAQYERITRVWDWVEQRCGVYSIPAEVDGYINSLADNGGKIPVQLHYGNPMYTSPSGIRPDAITPEPGSFHNADRSLYSIFWPPKTPDQWSAGVPELDLQCSGGGLFVAQGKHWIDLRSPPGRQVRSQ